MKQSTVHHNSQHPQEQLSVAGVHAVSSVLAWASQFEHHITFHFLLEFRLEQWDIHSFSGPGTHSAPISESDVDPSLGLQAGVVVVKPPGYLLEGNSQISAFRGYFLFKVRKVVFE